MRKKLKQIPVATKKGGQSLVSQSTFKSAVQQKLLSIN
jgi:hypothetical protein